MRSDIKLNYMKNQDSFIYNKDFIWHFFMLLLGGAIDPSTTSIHTQGRPYSRGTVPPCEERMELPPAIPGDTKARAGSLGNAQEISPV